MTRRRALALTTIASLFLGISLAGSEAAGEQKDLGEQIVGTWRYVSVDNVLPDGRREAIYGPNPQGLAIFDGDGRYLLFTARRGLPKFAANNRMEGSPEEYKAIVQGSIAHFGTYTVNEAENTITFHIEASTFPNWNGTEQKRPFTLKEDQFKWTTAASSGGVAEVVLKRVK